MKILRIQVLHGPNVYAHVPLLRMELDLEGLTGKESNEFQGFNERLVALLPGLQNHRCSRRRPGGFLERLAEGTYFGHVVEHVTLELSSVAGLSVSWGKSVYGGRPGLYHIMVEYKSEQGMTFLLRSAVELVTSLLHAQTYPAGEKAKEARRIADRNTLGPSTSAIVKAACERGIPSIRMDSTSSLVQFGYGTYRRLLQASTTDQTSVIGVDIASDKQLTKRLLDQAALPVPHGVVVGSESELRQAVEDLGFPLTVKPLNANQGKGVVLNVCSMEDALAAFQAALAYGPTVIVEEFLTGNDYRVLVVNGKAVAASHRIPAHIIGDGIHTVEELVGITNRDPERGEEHDRSLTTITLNAAADKLLKKQGYGRRDIPPAGRSVQLRSTANLSTGGTAIDVTDAMHPTVAQMCERAARLIGLDVCGIDLILPDISRPLSAGRGGIIEVNASPGLRMHMSPSRGKRREVGHAIVDFLFPPGTSGRIPVVAITGTNGKTTVARMIAYIFEQAGQTVGLTSTDGIWIGGEEVARGDLSGFKSARTVLSDPSVEVAVLETARGGIMHSGLAYDWSDVGVVTNVQPDHIGQDGIESVEDLVHVKALIDERVRKGGTVVLNFDDERVAAMARLPRVRGGNRTIAYFSLHAMTGRLAEHVRKGGKAYYLEAGRIIEDDGTGQHIIAGAAELPVTAGGMLEYHVANAMAALAAVRALGISAGQAAEALKSFDSTTHNPGRGNIYRVGHGHVMLDYGHNPHAFEATGQLRTKLPGKRITGIIAVPGDRADWVIAYAGKIAARSFDRIFIREDTDLRGRRPGEAAAILLTAVNDTDPAKECTIVLDWRTALETALQTMQEGELIVLFYEELAPAVEMLTGLQGVPVSSLSGGEQRVFAREKEQGIMKKRELT